MNTKTTTVTVHYQDLGNYHFFQSDDVLGLFIGSSNLHKAFHDVANAIELLMKANHNIDCKATPLMSLEEFVHASDSVETREDADTRTFALKMAA